VAYDRFRTDVTWDDQIEAMIKFIALLAPLLKDLGCRLNLETHGDETSFEAIRMIERLSPDILGVTLDTGNLPLQADLPSGAIERLAPYVHMTHCKDGIIFRSEEGLNQQIRSIGEGIIDWKTAIEVLTRHQPDLHLNIEEYRAENLLLWSTPGYRSHYPDLTKEDADEFNKLADECNKRIELGEMTSIIEYRKLPFNEEERDKSYIKDAGYLRRIIEEIH
jgi:sugar phosphate isomerase/epimerase